MPDPTIDVEVMLTQFNRLLGDVLKGSLNRNSFRPWEVDILLDIDNCELKDGKRREVLRRYQKAVRRDVERGATSLLKLSEYLERNRLRRESAAHPVQGRSPERNCTALS
jgi:hypothetical protein